MHGSRQQVVDYVKQLAVSIQDRPLEVEMVLFPPLVYISQMAELLEDHGLSSVVAVGGQNLHVQQTGAFTGEVSAEMLKDAGASWVLVGHSERRQYAFESNEIVADKFAAALRGGLRPILCVGESEAERDSGVEAEIVSTQIASVMALSGARLLGAGAIAYEPVWAIGTGKTATPSMAEEMHRLIRGQVTAADAGVPVPVLYGGSVKAENAESLFAEENIDGGLVGGASLQADELVVIARSMAA